MTLQEALKLQKKSKYHESKYVSSDGLTFDSIKEGQRWEELLLLKKAGEIDNLYRQIRFGLIPKQTDKKGKIIERAIDYVADFTYWTKDGEFIVEDVKGYRTKEYIMKRKMMLYFHGIRIKEV